MKKFISILLSLALVFSLAALTGCSSKKDDAAPSDEKSIGSVPADWAASRMKGTPRFRHRAAISPTGRI